MRWTNLPRVVLAASAAMALGAPIAAAGQPAGPCCPHNGQHRDQRYQKAVMAAHPSYYWRLGAPGGSPDVMGGTGTDATYGTQVTPNVPGAIACSDDVAVGLSGAVQDSIWESHVVAGAAAHTAAPGTAHFGIEIWAKPDFLDGNSRRIAARELPAGGYLLAGRSDALVFARVVHTASGDQWSTLSAPALPLHQWSYVVANYDADGVMRLWVDGQLVGQLASSLSLPGDPADGTAAGGRLLFGASGRLWNPSNPATHAYLEWDGALDEAAFYGPTATNLVRHQIRKHWRIGSGGHGCGCGHGGPGHAGDVHQGDGPGDGRPGDGQPGDGHSGDGPGDGHAGDGHPGDGHGWNGGRD